MSRRSIRRKMNNRQKYQLYPQYWKNYYRWKNAEPSRWRIFSWFKWKSECPYKPKWIDEYHEHYINCTVYSPYYW
jgi:hypothetical protein